MDFSAEKRELFLMQQAYSTLMSAANKVENRADKNIKGLTSRQYMAILAVLHLPPEETTIRNIAHKLGTTKQNANRLIAAIEKKGYLTVSGSKKDKRAVNIRVADSCLPVLLECAENGTAFLSDIFREFTENELKTLWRLLKKLHRFDGQEYAGFEDDANRRLGGVDENLQKKVFLAFRKTRNRQEDYHVCNG